MIGVTIGVGPYETLARYAAEALSEKAGIDTVVLGRQQYMTSRVPSPHFLKLRLFDVVPEESILYFDADMVCLNRWDPQIYAGREAVVGVAERRHPLIAEACRQWNIPIEKYVNTGLLFLNRSRHYEWFKETERFIETQPAMPLFDQTPLNIMRDRLNITLELIDRRHNWIGYGEGSLCYQVPVFMAHTIRPPSKTGNIDFFQGRYSPPINLSMEYCDEEMSELSGRIGHFAGIPQKGSLRFCKDGTISSSARVESAHYWFIYRTVNDSILVIASETDVLQEYSKLGTDRWTPRRHAPIEILGCDLIVES